VVSAILMCALEMAVVHSVSTFRHTSVSIIQCSFFSLPHPWTWKHLLSGWYRRLGNWMRSRERPGSVRQCWEV
jgi:hypothetical protein